ncbi:MAG TPA: hypothetical protein VG960_00655 [Caulobacteraceae bacterium]|nr:hypothetical protein [Caulobacteraceae bacterium]
MKSESPTTYPLAPLDQARAKLAPSAPADRALPAVAAAALFAVCALTFAAAAILAPPTVVTPMAKPGVQ